MHSVLLNYVDFTNVFTLFGESSSLHHSYFRPINFATRNTLTNSPHLTNVQKMNIRTRNKYTVIRQSLEVLL